MPNVVSESDLELLEQYLDEALEPSEAERVRVRVVEDPLFAAALDELRAERTMRESVWKSLEPSDRAVKELTNRVMAQTRRPTMWFHIGQFARFGSAAAACLLMGLFIGWAARDRSPGGPVLADTGAAAQVSQVSDRGVFAKPQLAMPGVIINEIREETPNEHTVQMLLVRQAPASSGLQRGDLVLAVNGSPVRDVQSLAATLSSAAGRPVVLRLLRSGNTTDITVNVAR